MNASADIYDELNDHPQTCRESVTIWSGDVSSLYERWPSPTTIVCDGPYGVGGYPGDPNNPSSLAQWYTPHIASMSAKATPATTLWFWNTEIGWALTHPVLERFGWQYVGCNIWNKGIAHIAGNCNTKTLRQFPVVTEVCAQYIMPATFEVADERVSMKKWLRSEWQRSGLPLNRTNVACGVKNAATRKYFTQCDLWYFPPVDAMIRLVAYANEHGNPAGRPYFSLDGSEPLKSQQWARMRAIFNLKPGLTNVWTEAALRGSERIRVQKSLGHPNQKPLKLMRRIIEASSDPGDVVWEPFGGLCSAAVAALDTGRICHSAEIMPQFYKLATKRLLRHGLEISLL